MILISSFPRSGNHLVRFLIEYLTGRPTLGGVGNPHDRPIHENGFPDDPGILDHVAGPPIGRKIHSPPEILRASEGCRITGQILISRNPVEAVLACKGGMDGQTGDVRLVRKLKALERQYEDAAWPRLRLIFEALAGGGDPARAELDRLAAFLGNDVLAEKYQTARRDYDRLIAINSTATGRAWTGIVSNGDPHFHWRQASLSRRYAVKALLGMYGLLHHR